MEKSEAGTNQPDGVTLGDAEKTITELVRYIVTQFLSVAVNTVFSNCRKIEEEEEEEVDVGNGDYNEASEKLLSVLEKSKLSVIFAACGKHIVKHHLEHIISISCLLLPELKLSEPIPDIDIEQIIRACVAEWYASDFQSALLDLIPSEEVQGALNRTEPSAYKLVKQTFYITFIHRLLSEAREKSWQQHQEKKKNQPETC